MKKLGLFISVLITIFFGSCDRNSNPVSGNGKTIDWEGNYPAVNTVCLDSILCASDRFIGTSFAPSVYIMNKNGSGMHALTNQWYTFAASWSPRRWKIIFIADTGYSNPSRGLFVMNSDGTDKKRLTPPNQDVFGVASWSPDGSNIAYIEIDSSVYNRGRVMLMNPDGTNIRAITDWWSGSPTRVTWSPDSRKIVFDGFKNPGSNTLYEINADGTGLSVLFTYPQSCYSASWSPDGNFIAFASFANIENMYYSKIFIYDFNAHRIRQITTGKSFDYNPTWSSDSKSLIFSSTPPGFNLMSSLYKVDISGSNLVQLTDNLGWDYDPSWCN